MSTLSNLYADKVFSEHPTVMWSLDDKLDFLSLLPESYINTSTWQTNATTFLIDQSSTTYLPIPNSPLISLASTETLLPDNYGEISLSINTTVKLSSLSEEMETFSIGFYLLSKTAFVKEVEVGYSYIDPDTLEIVSNSGITAFTAVESYGFISKTFTRPNINEDLNVFIKIRYQDIGNSPSSIYEFNINGLSVGQWSEEFALESVGIRPQQITDLIDISDSIGIPALAYGLQDVNGYYLLNGDFLAAKNYGIPMVYGAQNVTKIFPRSDGGPSVIVPGQGFLNESGQYKDYTLEFWLRAESQSNVSQKIIGPISSDDGLYISKSNMMLVVGGIVKSCFIDEWSRPMLIDITFSTNSATVMINGEQVISISFTNKDLSLSQSLNSDTGASRDWIGIYSHSEISELEIDCLAIYSYKVPAVVAKRRFVYGQGVQLPENSNTVYGGHSVSADFLFADYTNNYNYPNLSKWNSGFLDNGVIKDNVISIPDYALPSVVFDDALKTNSQWLEACLSDRTASVEDARNFFRIRPSSSDWSSTNGFILFDKINMLPSNTAGIYGIFKPIEFSTQEQILIKIENSLTSNYFVISLIENQIIYKIKTGSSAERILYSLSTVVPGVTFSVGVNIKSISATYGKDVAAFFGNRDQLKVYIGGSKDFAATFTGNIYNIGFTTDTNQSKLSSLFSDSGVATLPVDLTDVFYSYFDSSPDGQIEFTLDGGFYNPVTGSWDNLPDWSSIAVSGRDGGFYNSFVWSRFEDHIASYTLIPYINNGIMTLEISSDAYWEDYIPLTYLGKYVNDSNGDKVYDLDYMQINFSYPNAKDPVASSFDTSSNTLRTFITFQYLASGSNTSRSSFVNTEFAPSNNVIYPGANWMQTRYEVTNGTIIYPPQGADFNLLSLGISVEMSTESISRYPVRLKTLEVASKSLDISKPNPLGTKYGYDIYPYRKNGIYFDYKSNNPFVIYKGSSPHLYLTDNTGFKLCGDIVDTQPRGLSIPINSNKSSTYNIGALQFAFKYNQPLFPVDSKEIMELDSNNTNTRLFIKSTNSARTRARIYAVDSNTGIESSGIVFYVNGVASTNAYVSLNDWNYIGLQFTEVMSFESGYVGSISITGPGLFNNISYYELSEVQILSGYRFRRWFEVFDIAPTWNELVDPITLIWKDVLFIPEQKTYSLDPSLIYKLYLGVNRLVISDNSLLKFNNYKYKIYKDISWQSNVITPV